MSDGPQPDQANPEFRELWAALRLIREAVGELAPPGSVPNDEYLGPEPMREAEAIICGIHAITSAVPMKQRLSGDEVQGSQNAGQTEEQSQLNVVVKKTRTVQS